MKLAEMNSRAVTPIVHEQFTGILRKTVVDDDCIQVDPVAEPTELTSVSGLAVIIDYQTSDGSKGQRLITCKSLAERDQVQYLYAYCHHRRALRTFRVDRIMEVFDPWSGESMDPDAPFFDKFKADRIAKSGLSWGLSVKRRADMLALLNALVFLARCDRDYHPAEHSVLEQALTSFWLRLELPGDPDFDDILKHAKQLAPDGETFWLAMNRFRDDPQLAAVFKTNARCLVEADQVVRQEEMYWLLEIQDFLEND